MKSSWVVELALRPELMLESGERLTREAFFAAAWQFLSTRGLQGIHEGTMLSDEAAREGLETESWLVDSAEAPQGRDWVGSQPHEHPQLYFDSEANAHEAAALLTEVRGCEVVRIFEQTHQDWDAEWKKSFRGVAIAPDWRIVPPWELEGELAQGAKPSSVLVLNPGAGFGTGTHETTQLCLQAFAEALQGGFRAGSVLDFGSGSGILAIGAALRGAAPVHAVEIDPLAVDNARENARLNGADSAIRFELTLEALEGAEPANGYSVVFANILKPVLLQFSEALCTRLAPGGVMILSGLIEPDVEPVIAAYQKRLPRLRPRVLAKNEWRAVVWAG